MNFLKIPLIIFLVMSSSLCLAQEHEEHHEESEHEFKHHRVAILISHTHIPKGLLNLGEDNNIIVPSWGLNYEYWFNKNWAIGLHNDMEITTYVVEGPRQSIVERERPIIISLVGIYKLDNGLQFVAGLGREFEKNENFWVYRLGLEYEIEFGKHWDIAPALIFDFKEEILQFLGIGFNCRKTIRKMRKLLLCVLLVLGSHAAQSQILISLLFGDKLNSGKIEFGLDGGFNFTGISNVDGDKSLGSLNLGFYFDIKLKDQLFLNTGVLVKSTVGQDKIGEEGVMLLDPTLVYQDTGSYFQEIDYFHVPIGIKYRFKNHFYVKFGPQVALRTKAYLFYKRIDGDKTTLERIKNSDSFNRLEASLYGGLGYKLRNGEGMNIGVKYYYGLTNILKDSDVTLRNHGLYLYVNIPIGRGKAVQKEAENVEKSN